MAQAYSPFGMRLLRQIHLGLYLIQGESMNSQLQLRPTRPASELSQARDVADYGKSDCHHGRDKPCLGQSLKAGELKRQTRG